MSFVDGARAHLFEPLLFRGHSRRAHLFQALIKRRCGRQILLRFGGDLCGGRAMSAGAHSMAMRGRTFREELCGRRRHRRDNQTQACLKALIDRIERARQRRLRPRPICHDGRKRRGGRRAKRK